MAETLALGTVSLAVVAAALGLTDAFTSCQGLAWGLTLATAVDYTASLAGALTHFRLRVRA